MARLLSSIRDVDIFLRSIGEDIGFSARDKIKVKIFLMWADPGGGQDLIQVGGLDRWW